MENGKRRTVVILIATCVFGYLGLQSLYSLVLTSMNPELMIEPTVESIFDIVGDIVSIVAATLVVLGIWKHYWWTRILVAAFTLLVVVEVFCLPIFIDTIDFDVDYLIAMSIFVGPIVLFNIYFLKSKLIEEYFKR